MKYGMRLTCAILLLLVFLDGRAEMAALSSGTGDAEVAPREDNAGTRVKRTVCRFSTCPAGNLADRLSGGGRGTSPPGSTGSGGYGRMK
uniref:Calcitonin/calcitonin-related protein n=1 Tax=Ornithodoros coriaceus TaxID=92741 RepID=B2D2C2_ORNCO|nr:calcitonin/calcitonin-related protein [Ornithodoros coriaceus]